MRPLILLLLASLPLVAQPFYLSRLTDTSIPGQSLGRYRGFYGPAIEASILPRKLVVDSRGTIYCLESDSVVRIRTDGVVEPVTGLGAEPSGDGGPAMAATLLSPQGIAIDGADNLYIVGPDGVRRISAAGNIHKITSIVRGTGAAVGPDGSLFVADGPNIWRLSPAGRISIEAGSGVPGYPPTFLADIDATDLAVASDGTLYLAETKRGRITVISPSGSTQAIEYYGVTGITFTVDDTPIVTGSGGVNSWGDSQPTRIPGPRGVVDVEVGPNGRLYFASQWWLPGFMGSAGTDVGGVHVSDFGEEITHLAGCQTASCRTEGVPAREIRLAWPWGLALDPSGNVLLSDYPGSVNRITPDGKFQTLLSDDAYSREIAIDRSGRIYLGRGDNVDRLLPDGSLERFASEFASVRGMAIDADDNLLVSDYRGILKLTPEGLPSTFGQGGWSFGWRSGGMTVDALGDLLVTHPDSHFVVRVPADVRWSPFAGSRFSQGYTGDGGPATEALLDFPNDVALDRAGNVYIASRPPRIVTPDGIIRTLDLRHWNQPETPVTLNINRIVTDPQDRLYLTTESGVFLASPSLADLPGHAPALAWTGIRHAATFAFQAISPGEIVSLFGTQLGPLDGLSSTLDAGGRLPTELDGVRVLFDGEAAPLLYVQNGQVNCIAPFSLDGREVVVIRIERHGRVSNEITVPVTRAVPGVFRTGPTQPAILNQDYSLNSDQSPARRGEWVMIYATGFGQTEPPGEDGALNTSPLPQPRLQVRVTIGGGLVEVAYAGPAPGLVAGAMQINARIPPPNPFFKPPRLLELVVIVGGVRSRAEFIVVAED